MKPFQHVEMYKPRRSRFNLSSYRIMDCDMGILYPVYCKKMVPGDHFKLGHEVVVRMNPSIAPIMHEVNVFLHAFFCPFRPMWPKPIYANSVVQTPEPGSWEDFMTGGPDGLLSPTKPKWTPGPEVGVDSLWHRMGFELVNSGVVSTVGPFPDAWPKRAYNWVWNEYYRDQTYMDPVDLDDEGLKRRCWEKDYFTSALPWQQRGQAPALPITGFTNAEFLGAIQNAVEVGVGSITNSSFFSAASGVTYMGNQYVTGSPIPSASVAQVRAWLNNNQVDFSDAATFDVSDLRLAFQTQKFLERNARAGARYTEFLRAHWGVSPRDDRLQRPEFIGGARMPLVVSEVLQTSSTDGTTPQGNLAGHGMSLDRGSIGSYFAQEFGLVIILLSIMPRPLYQYGLDREWLGETRFDELLPEFVSLSEQPIYNIEIKRHSTEEQNIGVFGFQGRYDEYRVSRSMALGRLNSAYPQNLSFWHLGRVFSSYPVLNAEFLECRPRKDWLAVPSEPAFIVNCGIVNRAVRPLPIVGTPGLIDHH